MLVSAIQDAKDGDMGAKYFLGTDVALLYAHANGIHADKLAEWDEKSKEWIKFHETNFPNRRCTPYSRAYNVEVLDAWDNR